MSFSITTILAQLTGYVAPPFLPARFANNEGTFRYSKDYRADVAASVTPYFNRFDALGRPYTMPVQLNDVWLPFEPILSVRLLKNIVKTPVAGRKGTVKELVNIDDYQITLTSVFVSPDDNYPTADVEWLHSLFEINETVRILSPLTDILNIESVVIENINLLAMPGKQNMQAFEINMISDDDFVSAAFFDDEQINVLTA